jgi:oligopeptide/dipeptide ABC transporter ATP-binding protein
MTRAAVLEVRELSVSGPQGQPILDRVALTLRAGEVTAIVGETGSGKTTILNCILGLLPRTLRATSGEAWLDDGAPVDLLSLREDALRRYLGVKIGYVPQDVRSGLNPLMTAHATVLEAARRGPGPARARADAALRRAGLAAEFVVRDASRRPAKLSGGQCQRVLFAQAIANEPRVLLLDEPTASLDPPTRRAVQATIREHASERCAVGLVTHDLATVSGLADTVAVLYLGRVVELGPAERVLRQPQHPYTRGLLRCVPRLDSQAALVPIPGDPPASALEITGCKFHPRCPFVEARCKQAEPELRLVEPLREVACHVVVGPEP